MRHSRTRSGARACLAALAAAALGAGCSSERLVVVTLDAEDSVKPLITELSVTSTVHPAPQKLGVGADGAASPAFPFKLGIYVPHDTTVLSVTVDGLSASGATVATGSGEFDMLDRQVVHFDSMPVCLSPGGTGQCTLPGDDGGGAPDAGDAGAGDAGDDAGAGDAGDDAGAGDASDDAGGACPAPGATVSFDGGVDAGVAVPPDCDTYCATVIPACPMMFPSTDVCRAMCALSTDNPVSENNADLACRETPMQLGPSPCMEASLITGIFCTPGTCPIYCQMGAAICGSAFPDSHDCYSLCNSIAQGEPGAATGNTMECRMTALEQALVDKSFCAWALPAPACGPCRP
jgi:hypothetical protein